MFYEFLVKKLKGSGGDVSDTATTILSQEFDDELHKPIIKNIQNCVKYVHLMNNIWGTNHTDIQQADIIKKCVFYCALLIAIASVFGLFLLKIKNVKQLVRHLKRL